MRFYVYIYIIVFTLLLGWLMPQQGRNRIYYIFFMTALLTFIGGFRYEHLSGDLMKYHYTFNLVGDYGWFSPEVINGGRNAGFYMLMKLVNHLTAGNFQFLLFLIALVIHVSLGIVVYRYSPKPWMSYLVWNSLGLFIFGLSAIKQALAMAFLLLSLIGVFERRPKQYLFMVLLAALIHTPSLVFLPAYWLADRKVSFRILIAYAFLGVLLYLFRNRVAGFITQFYYEEHEDFIDSGGVGTRVLMIVLIAMCGVLLKGFQERNFQALFHFMCISAMLQLLAGFDNIFTRLTDYYFQTSVLFIPMIFYEKKTDIRTTGMPAVFRFNQEGNKLIVAVVCTVLLYFYWVFALNSGKLAYTVDDLLNFRFMWDVP